MYCENTSLHSINFLFFLFLLTLKPNQSHFFPIFYIHMGGNKEKERECGGSPAPPEDQPPKGAGLNPPRVRTSFAQGTQAETSQGASNILILLCLCVCVCVCKAYIIHTNITKYRTTRLELYKPNNQGNYKETSSQSTQRAPTSLIQLPKHPEGAWLSPQDTKHCTQATKKSKTLSTVFVTFNQIQVRT